MKHLGSKGLTAYLRLRIWWLGIEINLLRRKLTRKYRSEPSIRGWRTRRGRA